MSTTDLDTITARAMARLPAALDAERAARLANEARLDAAVAKGLARLRAGREDNASIPSHDPLHDPIEALSSGPGSEAVTSTGGRCGLTVVQRGPAGKPGRILRVLCGTKACADCGPRYRAARVEHYAELCAAEPIINYTEVTKHGWALLRKKLSGKADYVRVPIRPDRFAAQRFAVLTTADVGEPVDNAGPLLTRLFDEMPLDARVSSSRSWAVQSDDRASDYETVGVTHMPLDEVADAVRQVAPDLIGQRLPFINVDGWSLHWPDEGDEAAQRALSGVWARVGMQHPGRRTSRSVAA